MKIWNFLLLLLFTSYLGGEILLFINGDRLIGSPSGIEGESVVWQSEVFDTPLKAPLSEVDKILMSDDNMGGVTLKNVSFLMNRGDIVQGNIKGADEKSFLVQTSWGGEISLDRSMVEKIKFNEGGRNFLKSDTKISDWKEVSNRKKWLDTKNGIGVRGRGAICKEIDIDELFKVSFKLKIKDSPRVRMLFLATEGQVYEPESYLEVVIQRRNFLGRVRNLGDLETVGQVNNLQELQDMDSANFSFYVNLKKQVMGAYLNGNEIARWSLPKGIGLGKWVYLYSEYEGEVVMEDFSISSWNGAFPVTKKRKSDFQPEGEKPLILLHNGDLLEATLKNVSEDDLLAKTDLGSVKVPYSRVSLVDFTRAPYNEARREKRDVTVQLIDGSMMTMILKEWGEDALIGYSQQFGEVSIKVSEVHSVDFNIYQD